jgi:hypothetical protein
MRNRRTDAAGPTHQCAEDQAFAKSTRDPTF